MSQLIKDANCLIVDTETTGIGPSAEVIEVGLILYSIGDQCVLESLSYVLPTARENAAIGINKIPQAALSKASLVDIHRFHIPLANHMKARSSFFVSHNAEFDQRFIQPSVGRPWLCTQFDFEWARASRPALGLAQLAHEYGISPPASHRALLDCYVIAELFNRSADLPAQFARALRPSAIVEVAPDYVEVADKLGVSFKAHGFKCDGQRWTRRIAVEDIEKLPFPIVVIKRMRPAEEDLLCALMSSSQL